MPQKRKHALKQARNIAKNLGVAYLWQPWDSHEWRATQYEPPKEWVYKKYAAITANGDVIVVDVYI